MKVYWAASNVTQGSLVSRALYYPPEPVEAFRGYIAQHKHNNFKLCPAYLDHMNNLFSLRFPVSYTLDLMQDRVGTRSYDQEFFNNFVFIRDMPQRLISFNVRYVFFAEQSCTMSLQQPYMEDNDLANKTVSMPGTFDIGQWFRTTDYTVQVKSNVDSLNIERGDVYNYLRVDTDEPVEFVRFDYTDELDRIQRDILQSKMILGNKSPKLSYYYQLFKQSMYRKKILSLIQQNILE
jgi:hypothetical protein